MDLETFVKESIVQILRGVREAQKEAKNLDGAEIRSKVSSRFNKGEGRSDVTIQADAINFDVAVTTSKDRGMKGKAGITVYSVFEVGAEGAVQHGTETVSRVRFVVPVVYPNPPK